MNVPEDTRLPIVYIKDVVDLSILALENISNLKNRIYNVASLTPSPTAKELVNAAYKYVKNASIEFKPDPLVTKIVRSWPRDFDCSRLRSELFWEPQYNNCSLLVEDFVKAVKTNPEMFYV